MKSVNSAKVVSNILNKLSEFAFVNSFLYLYNYEYM